MAHRIYYIGINWESFPFPPPVDVVEKTLAPVGDWIRLNKFTWFISTTYSSKEVYEMLRQVLTSVSQILVVKIDPTDRFGWAPQWVWDWIDSQRQETPRTLAGILSQAPPSGGIGGSGSGFGGIGTQQSPGSGIGGQR
jgi:hypothetical protein